MKQKNMDCCSKTCRYFYHLTLPNIIEPELLQPAKPLHLFVCFCLKLKLESCALACCIGTTTITAADNIATAARTETIINVELFILSHFEYLYDYILTLRKIILNCHSRNNSYNVIDR